MKDILKIDGYGGLFVGLTVFIFRSHIAQIYELPIQIVTTSALVNLAYGFFGLTNLMITRKVQLFRILVYANFFWAACCVVFVGLHFRELSVFTIAHALLEGSYVFALAVMERRHFTTIVEHNKFT
jgi:hypothetical protein